MDARLAVFCKPISSISHYLTISDPLRDFREKGVLTHAHGTLYHRIWAKMKNLLSYSKVLINKETFMANHGSFPRDFHKEFSEQGNSYLVK